MAVYFFTMLYHNEFIQSPVIAIFQYFTVEQNWSEHLFS